MKDVLVIRIRQEGAVVSAMTLLLSTATTL
jgi:hypothetical protein